MSRSIPPVVPEPVAATQRSPGSDGASKISFRQLKIGSVRLSSLLLHYSAQWIFWSDPTVPRFFRGCRRRLRPLIENMFHTFLNYMQETHQNFSGGLGRRYEREQLCEQRFYVSGIDFSLLAPTKDSLGKSLVILSSGLSAEWEDIIVLVTVH